MWEKLNEITAKFFEISSSSNSVGSSNEPVSLCPLSTDAPTTHRRSGAITKSFSQWIENELKEKWSLLYDTNEAWYGIMTTNLAEVYN